MERTTMWTGPERSQNEQISDGARHRQGRRRLSLPLLTVFATLGSTISISLNTAAFTFAVLAASAASAPPVCDRSDEACDGEDDDVDRA